MTNGQTGVSSFNGNGVFVSNSWRNSFSPSGFSLRWRPSMGIDLNVSRRLNKCGTICKAMSKEESNGQLLGDLLLEKEFEFKPSFNEYLKVMESVKTVRDRKQANGSEKSVGKLRKTFLNDENVNLGELEEHSNRKKGLKGFKRDESFKSRDGFTKKESKMNKITEPKSRFDRKEGNVVGKAKRKPGGVTMDRKWQTHQTTEEEVELEETHMGKNDTSQKGYESSRKWSQFQVKGDNMDIRRKYEHKAGSSQMLGKKGTSDCRLDYRSNGNVSAREKNDVGINKLHEKIGRNYIKDDKFNGKESMPRQIKLTRRTKVIREKVDEKSLKVERAAFRTLDESNEIMDQPRLPRMEMEERIQKLANS